MDGSEAVASLQDEVPKKRQGLENMSKEELVKKCKSLLAIAQKAKEAKDEANEEVKALKEKLNTLTTQPDSRILKENDEAKENNWERQVNAMQEMITNLTDQKLVYAMEMDAFKKKTSKLEEELRCLKEKEISLSNRVSELEIERDGFERQARRLEKEAESLTLAMDATERQGNEALSAAKTEIEQLKIELAQLMSKSEVVPSVEHVTEQVDILGLQNQLEIEKEKHCLIQKEIDLFVNNITNSDNTLETMSEFRVLNLAWEAVIELKNHNFKLAQEITQMQKIETERNAYSEEISKLKKLVSDGRAAQEQIRELTEDQEVLHSQIKSLKAAMVTFSECKEKLGAVQTENEALCAKISEFEKTKQSEQQFPSRKELETERNALQIQVKELAEKLGASESEKLQLKENVNELQTLNLDKKLCEEKLEKILSENQTLHENICQTKEELESCQSEMSKLHGERESLACTLSELAGENEKMKIQLTESSKEIEKLCDQVKTLKSETEESNMLKAKYLEMQSQKEALQERITGLQSSVEESGVEKEELLRMASERETQLKNLEKEAKDELNAAETEKAALRVKIEGLEESFREFSGKNSSFQDEMKDLVERLKTMEHDLNEHKLYKENSIADMQALRLENETLKEASVTHVKMLQDEKAKLEQELHQAVSNLEKKVSCEAKLGEVEADRRVVISELENLRLMLSELEGEKDQLRDQNERLKETLGTLEERLRAAEEGAEGVREALENKVNSLQSTLREKEALELKLTEMKDKVQEIEDAKNLLEGESRSLRESLKEQNKVLERLLEVEEGKDGMEREIEVLRASLKEEGSMKACLEAEKAALEKEVAALRLTVKDEDKVMERLREVEEEKDGMEREIETLRISLKEESRLREILRNEKEEKEALEKELETLKLSEAKGRENLRAVVERSTLLEKEVEELKITLKEHSKFKEELEEALAQKELFSKELENLQLVQEEFSKLQEELKKAIEEKNIVAIANEELLKQSTTLKEKYRNVELEKEALGKTLQDVKTLVFKWEELVKELFDANVLDNILVLLTQEEVSNDKSHEKTSLAPDVASFGLKFSDDSPQNIPIQEVIQVLKKSLNDLCRINKNSEEIANSVKKLKDEKCKQRKDLEKKLLRLKTQHEDFKKNKELEQTSLIKDIMAIRETIGAESNLDYSQNNISENLQEMSVQVKQTIADLNEEKQRLKEVIAMMEDERINEKAVISDLQKKVKELDEVKCNAEQQLISEMKGVNTVLKKRGEAIKALEAEVARLSSQLLEEQQAKKQVAVAVNQSLTSKEGHLNQCDASHLAEVNERKDEALEEECKSLRLQVSELEKQISSLSMKGSNACDNVGSEVLSTSTISKTEEASRLRDVEESFEDRYTKLRMVAVKLKKRCTELEGDRKRADELQGRVNNMSKEINNLSTQAKNAKSLQLECDRLQDKVDELGKENSNLKKALKESVDEIAANKIQVHEYKEEKNHLASTLEVMNKEKTALDSSLQEANCKRRNAEKELQKLEQELNALRVKLSQEEARCADALKQLEEGKQTWKRGNVLSLEMDALEQSAADLRRQLEESRQEGTKLKESLRQTKEELDKSKIKEEEAKLNRGLLKETQSKLADCEKLKNEANSNVERLRREVETQSLQLGKLMAETKRQSDSFRTQQEAVLTQASALEAQVTRLRAELLERNLELEQVRSDFAAYKVRAQAVLLKKEQERNAEGAGGSQRIKEEEEAKELEWERERRQLERVADGLKRTLEDATSQLDEVQADREILQEKCQTLELECQRLRDSSKELEDHYKEDIFQARIKLDTLVRSYQQQLEELQNKYRSETLSLREQVEKLKEEKEALVAQQSSLDNHKRSRGLDDQTRGSGGQRSWALTSETPFEGRSATEMALHPREEGEGSESVDSPPSPHSSFNSRSHGKVGANGRRKKKGLLPLDQLLSSSLPDEEEADAVDQEMLPGDEDDRNVGDWVSGHRSSYNLIATLERRSKHLSLLLSEAESEGARLAQQNALLKEEVRRLERCAERTEHTQNAEYLKNVLIKFITLQGGDERSRLVPVLTTILKLSPEETHQLNAVASGGALDSGQVAGAARGWGSYLHLWPSAP
ncbi:GRIP and coiled-coil domain-containing protein 2-like isoform X2 [Hetaerina americana]|uniref:GRIP and coiled-coil domain-containing protein 2-like isoform X2 n=1 Tax=Hetaerina americana TaxID=62018 RepID=UPI003A7F56BA